MDNGAKSYYRYLDGDDNGLAEIINEYNIGLSLYINSILNDMCISEEIMQDTFVKLAINKPKFKNKCNFKTWLYSMARNCAIDYLRHRARYTDKPIDELFLESDELDIEKQYIQEEQKIELHHAMKNLKPEYFQVLYLMYFEDFDTSSISLIMHKTKRQVGDLLYRAKRALRSELEKVGFTYEEF